MSSTLAALAILAQDPQQEALKKVLQDNQVRGAWVYNDLKQGFAEAESSKKPMLVVFR